MMIYLSNLLQKEWNDVKMYTLSYDQELFSKVINFEIVVWNKFSIAKKIRKSDYIIVWNSPMHFVWAFSKAFFRSNAKLIWWHHHYPWYYAENTNFLILMKKYSEKLALKYVDTLLSNSYYLQKSLKQIYSLNSKVLYPLVDTQFVRKSTLQKTNRTPVIFTYGRWVQWKNIKQIFDTYLYLQNKVSSLQLYIWWIWEELDMYKEKFKTDKNISFLWLLDVESIINTFKQSSLFLFPSLVDSFWMTILEAQVSGVPVIAFDKNWAKEIIINWKTGFLVKDSQEFNEKTYLLLNDFELLKDFSKNALVLSEKFWETSFRAQLEEIFNQ